MTEPGASPISQQNAALTEAGAGPFEQIAALRLAGAERFDPVRLHYIEVLARRAAEQQGQLKIVLEAKLGQALAALRKRLEQAQAGAGQASDPLPPAHPQASLAELTRLITQRTPQEAGPGPVGGAGKAPEQATTAYFRNTWSRLSVDKRVTQALEQAPQNAGPINSHMLVLRSLALMRDISPDYLTRFTAYVDTLLCLDQGDKAKPVVAKKAAEADAGKKPKSRTVRALAK